MKPFKQHLKMGKSKTTPKPNQLSSHFSIESPLLHHHEITFTGKRGYFFFPPEIRNQIMDLVLVPGDIYLRPRPIIGCSRSNFHRKRYGFQLLATCRQAYKEGHELYYTSNTFNLPSGRDHWSEQLFILVQPKHRIMIQYLAINCSIYDIHYPDSIHEIGKAADQTLMEYVDFDFHINGPGGSIPLTELRRAYCPAACDILLHLWLRKLTYVWFKFPGLKNLRVTFMEISDPWLIQYFGLPQDQMQKDKLLQGLRQGDVRDLYHPIRTIDLSRDDLALALEKIISDSKVHPSRQLPLTKAVEEATTKARGVLEYEFGQIGREEEGQRYQEFILMMKSSWATDRLSGKWPYWEQRYQEE